MPFVQRVVQPTYLSRSHGNRICDRPPRTIARTGAVSRQKSSQLCAKTTKVLVHSAANAEPPRPSVSSTNAVAGAGAAVTPCNGEEDGSLVSPSSVEKSSTSCCCCRKQHCCNGTVGNNNNNNNNNNSNNNNNNNSTSTNGNSKNGHNKGIIGSCCNAKTNSLSSFSYSTADIDIDVVDDEVDSGGATTSGRHQRCRGVSLDSGERGREEKSDASKEFLASRSGYGKDDDYCYSSCNGGSNSHRAHVADYDDEDDEDDDDDDDGDEDTDADDIAAVTPTIVTGNELESISNITLSNALRQLASLVIIASDIFQNLNKELQNVGDRTRGIKVKIDALDKRVSQFDPKLVTVPESDLGTFAQRKTHHQCDKSFHKELFTRETRPTSVKVLYEEAAKISECRLQASRNDTVDSCTGAVDELVCTPVFGKANRKMRTRIDAEIEIRLPAGIEDLRKWTSSEALGDVTVTPDCLNRVDASISTSIVIGDNGVLTPALSPSVLSADAVDAIYSINNSNDNLQIPNDINKDVPLNHRLPSPEEQCKLLALKYPAEIISVDTSGKRFERMCLARKSTTGCALGMAEANNLNDDIQTVSRRSRSRKVRGKRRNTIAGIDQKEIQDAANGTDTNDSGKNNLTATEGYAVTTNDNNDESDEENNKVGRSKSSDILKKESVALPYDKGKSTLTRLNSLKQWGRNRFKFITPGSKAGGKSPPKSVTQNSSDSSASGGGGGGCGSGSGSGVVSGDIDDECIVHELTKQKSELFEKEGRFSHERKPSYSSSEKSVSLASNAGKSQGTHKLVSLSSGAVKLRDTSSLNRQRRNGINGHNKDEPHSSSGNWSASSESGRTSIGSEITIQPKSSASNTSLNVSSFHPGSGPPSSIISRRRFLTTSASSSVTSDGTATPDLQVSEPYNDDETSSAYSCDTEGYYTSFHMDSGLRTLKEEEPMSPLQTSSTHPSNYSFGSVSNQTVLTAENEYELFGRGSTSTTTSSAGTVCTTLLVSEHGPDVPERISSLSKLNKGNNSASTSTLERSYSSSTVGSTLERTGTIKRNVLAMAKDAVAYDEKSTSTTDSSPASQESEFTFETRMAERSEQPLPPPSITNSEVEYSESSDLEGVERIERIKQKTAMTAKRIPSMCIITPTTSDDENISTVTSATDSDREYVVNYATPYATVDMLDTKKDYNLNHLKRTLQHPLHNMLDKLKVVLPSSKRKSPAKGDAEDDIYDTAGEYVTIADISNNNKHTKNPSAMKSGNLGIYYSNDIVRRNLDTVLSGNVKRETEYVSLNELPCNIRQASNIAHPFALAATVGTVDTEKINSQCAASERVEVTSAEVSVASPLVAAAENESTAAPSSLTASANTTAANRGARVKMNSQGKIIYDSDSLKRRKGAHTTFAPGPYVKETESALLLQLPNAAPPISESNIKVHSQPATNKSVLALINGGGCANRKVTNVRPVVTHRPPVIVNMTTKCLDRPPPPLPPAKAMMAPPMPSPSSSSTSSTLTSTSSASTSSSASSPSSTTSASTVLDEGYHRFSKIGTSTPREKTPATSMPSDNSGLTAAFDRNAPVYWTLQNRRQAKPSTTSSTAKDDLYATPISRANRNAVSKSNAELQRSTNISPIVPRARGNIFTSTPTKVFHNSDSLLTVENGSVMQPSSRSLQKTDDNSPERFNTCSDRIGTSKTSLMDFKKLLLAKSAKNTPVQKMSAVEILKMNKRDGEKTAPGSNGTDNKSNANAQSINSPMTLLDLSGSPKTFASRRMLRQGQFGSPSKSFAPKQRSAQWRMNSMRTDVMSTTIPEANSEEDHSNSSGGSNHSGSRPSSEVGDAFDRSELISEETFDLKKNIFLQTEENNFMKGELKIPFGKANGPPVPKYIKSLSFNGKPLENSFNPSLLAHTITANANQHYGANDLIIKSNNIASKIFTTSHSPNSAINKEANIFPALETAL